MMNKLILPVLAVVFVSACISGEPTTLALGRGLEITSLVADQPDIQSGRILRISMDVENSGNTKVFDDKSLAFLIIPGDWEFSDSTEFQKFGKDLDTADPVRGVAAETDQVIWRLTSPVVPSGQTRQDTFEARVYYDYSTKTSGNI